MFQTLRARLILICVAITVAALFALSMATFWTARSSTLSDIDENIGQLTRAHASTLTDWVQDKQRITVEWIHNNDRGSKVWVLQPTYMKYWDDELYGEKETEEFIFQK